jgi:neurotransmitter:Na+ symporter, NSS family
VWSSHANFVLAGAGVAIGFNNFWQFPSLVFSHGGGAFVIVYLLCLLLLGLPLLVAAFMIGRIGRDAPDTAFRHASGFAHAEGPWWLIGTVAVFGGFLIFSCLCVIAGWTAAFGLRAGAGVFSGLTADGVNSIFTQLVMDTEKQLFWYSLFIVSVVFVSARGLVAGLEPVIRYAVPALLGLIMLLLLYASTLEGFSRATLEALMPDFPKLSWSGVLAAARHAFFSLGLGVGAMFMYGAYVDRNAPLVRLTIYIVLIDTMAGFAAALTVYAVLYAGAVEPEAGSALLFHALPLAFDSLPFGRFALTTFFVMLVLAAWLYGLALFEPVVKWIMEHLRWDRAHAAIACGVVAWIAVSVAAFSFNAWSFSFRFFGEPRTFGLFDVFQIVTNHVLLPVVGIGTAVFAGWVLTPELSRRALNLRSPCAFDAWLWLVRIVAPIVLVGVMLSRQ